MMETQLKIDYATTASQGGSSSKAALWTGRVISGLVVAFLVLDGAMKLFKPAPVVDAFVKTGWDPNLAVGIGVLLLVCVALYVIPRTAILGAILLTGYMGGAVANNVRLEQGWFSIVFATVFGVLVWAGLYLRDEKIRALIPFRG